MVSGPARLRNYNETLVYRLLDVMRPEPADYSASTPLFTVTAKEFGGKAKEREKWYGTPYQVQFKPQVVLAYLRRFIREYPLQTKP